MNDLTVTLQQHTDRTVINVAGEIDLDTCPALAKATGAVPQGGTALHLEMSGVSFMDSSGLNLLLQLCQRLLAEGGQLVVAGLQGQPAKVLRLTGAYDLLVASPADTADVAAA